MDLSFWSITLVAVKFISYLPLAALSGGLAIQWLVLSQKYSQSAEHTSYLMKIRRWQIIWVSVGLLCTILHLPIEAAALADSGWTGLTDGLMINIVWQSSIGSQTGLRFVGLLVALIILLLNKKQFIVNSNALSLFNFIAVILISASFVFTGHAVNEGLLVQFVLGMHVIAMSIWLGSLWPLYQSSRYFSDAEIKNLMHNFGRLAVVVVLALITCGIIMLFQFIHSLDQLLFTSYGQLMLLKLILVSIMLFLAAWHKLVLVPRILEKGKIQLIKSIGKEAIIGLAVLIITSVFTTLVGPA